MFLSFVAMLVMVVMVNACGSDSAIGGPAANNGIIDPGDIDNDEVIEPDANGAQVLCLDPFNTGNCSSESSGSASAKLAAPGVPTNYSLYFCRALNDMDTAINNPDQINNLCVDVTNDVSGGVYSTTLTFPVGGCDFFFYMIVPNGSNVGEMRADGISINGTPVPGVCTRGDALDYMTAEACGFREETGSIFVTPNPLSCTDTEISAELVVSGNASVLDDGSMIDPSEVEIKGGGDLSAVAINIESTYLRDVTTGAPALVPLSDHATFSGGAWRATFRTLASIDSSYIHLYRDTLGFPGFQHLVMGTYLFGTPSGGSACATGELTYVTDLMAGAGTFYAYTPSGYTALGCVMNDDDNREITYTGP